MLGRVPDKSPILHNILKITLRCLIAGNGWLPLCNLWDFFALISLNSDLPSLLEYFWKNSPPLLIITLPSPPPHPTPSPVYLLELYISEGRSIKNEIVGTKQNRKLFSLTMWTKKLKKLLFIKAYLQAL